MKDLSVDVRCLALIKENGRNGESLPQLSHLQKKKTAGRLGGLDLNSLNATRIIGHPARWVYISDFNRSVGELVIQKHFHGRVAEAEEVPPDAMPWYAHIICNAVERSQPRHGVNNLSRASHAMDRKTYDVVPPRFRESISTADAARRILPLKDSLYIWGGVIEEYTSIQRPVYYSRQKVATDTIIKKPTFHIRMGFRGQERSGSYRLTDLEKWLPTWPIVGSYREKLKGRLSSLYAL